MKTEQKHTEQKEMITQHCYFHPKKKQQKIINIFHPCKIDPARFNTIYPFSLQQFHTINVVATFWFMDQVLARGWHFTKYILNSILIKRYLILFKVSKYFTTERVNKSSYSYDLTLKGGTQKSAFSLLSAHTIPSDCETYFKFEN